MSVSLSSFAWWLWGGKAKDPALNGSAINSTTREWGLGVREVENVKFPSVKGDKIASTRKVKRKWKSREERRIDTEYDGVLVPSDGVCLSGSESDDSDWSIGWLEPHAPDFQSDDQGSFAVLVPCYRNGSKEFDAVPNNQFLSCIKNLPDDCAGISITAFPHVDWDIMLGFVRGDLCRYGEICKLTLNYMFSWLSPRSSSVSVLHAYGDMEEKVQNVLKLIEEDGDTFAKRAEMYYERRPGIINFIEESYRAYRALAERYDHMSTDLQNANTTLATVCPERVQLAMDNEEEDGSKFQSRKNLQAKPKAANSDIIVCKSGLSKSEALQEIDKLQKEIMALQTVKEFVKSSYESGLQKYWEIEARVTELQERVLGLEEEFNVGKGNEDGEARDLMAEEVLKLCEETLAKLEEKQERSTEEAKEEYKRVENAREKLNSLKQKFLSNKLNEGGEKPLELEKESGYLEQEKRVSDELREKIAGHFDLGYKESPDVMDLTEKIDELVSKVINLETSVSSQPALIDKLRIETDELQAQIRILEDEKATLIDGNDSLTTKLREMEEKCEKLEDLNLNLENQNNHLQAHFTEARCSLDHLSEYMESTLEEESIVEIGSPEELDKREDFMISTGSKTPAGEHKIEQFSNSDAFSEKREDPNSLEKVEKQGVFRTEENVVIINNEPWGVEKKKEEMNWREMLLDGVKDKETILLTEYITILRNYKDLRKKLSDVERKNRDRIFETTVQLRELRSLIAKRDKEIQFLRQKLYENKDLNVDDGEISVLFEVPQANEEDEYVKLILVNEPRTISPLEEKLRMNIDALLDENLDFWLRFSTSSYQIQKFKSGFLDLESEIEKIKENKEKRNQEGIAKRAMKLELKTIYMHLVEIKTEARLWIENSAVLKDELQRRFASLCEIEEEIAKALNAGAEEEEMRFTSHEAAMFQGEVSNMKLENNKVRDELEAGLDCVNKLKQDIEKTIGKLSVEFGLFGSKSCDESQFGRVRIPLRSFIFGTKLMKKSSIFSFMHRRKRSLDLRSGMPM